MVQEKIEEKQAWVTCFFTNILLSYMRENLGERKAIDCPSLFRGIDGFEMPANPESFLRDVNNWVPLAIIRELHLQCERISERKDIAYHAARAYFEADREGAPSLFEIIFRVLNDLRSVLGYANLVGSLVQVSYLKLQAFEKQRPAPDLYMLAEFNPSARPAVGSVNLLRGICEGIALLDPITEQVQCIEEISQLWIEDIIREFPNFSVRREGDRLYVHSRDSQQPIVEAIKVPLKTEVIPLSPEFRLHLPEAVVEPSRDGRIAVLTNMEEIDPEKKSNAVAAYKIVRPGVVSDGPLVYPFDEGIIYNAPYSLFRFVWQRGPKPQARLSAENVRQEISQLLFNYVKQTQIRMVQFNIEKRRLTLENIQLRRQIEQEYSFAGIVGGSHKTLDLFRLVRSIAETDVTVILQGETGTGKELIARAIHYNSPRKAKRFVAVNCGALSETLLESELFGHEKGAFTGATAQRKGIFEVADGGTLFLDEIGEITPATQVKLLRVLQDGEFQRVGGSDTIKVDVRILAATNKNLEELVKKGPFRQDLYYRLNVFPIMVPPLRERLDDIPLLVSHFIDKRKQSLNKKVTGASPQLMGMLMAHPWPGNVRELENVIQRMMVVCKGEILDVEDLPVEMRGKLSEAKPQPKDLRGIARESAEMIEKRAILDALEKTSGNVTQAAKALGVSRATLQNKMKAYGLRGIKG